MSMSEGKKTLKACRPLLHDPGIGINSGGSWGQR